MDQSPRRHLPCLALALSVCAASAGAQITINGPTNHRASIGLTGCFLQIGTSTLTPDPVTRLAPPVAGGPLDVTFMADIAEYPGWTLAFGAALSGTLQITDYLATNRPDRGPCRGGARMDATYTRAATDPLVLTFVNRFVSGPPNSAGTHIDPFPNEAGDTEPFYYTAAQRTQFGLRFVDNPNRACPFNSSATTTFDTYIVSFDAGTKTVTAHDGWHWGYTVQCIFVYPEPSRFLLTATGLLLLAGAAWAARRAAAGG